MNSGGKSYSHTKVNSTLWGLMVESGVKEAWEPKSNCVLSKIVKHGGGSIMVWGCMSWGVDYNQRGK